MKYLFILLLPILIFSIYLNPLERSKFYANFTKTKAHIVKEIEIANARRIRQERIDHWRDTLARYNSPFVKESNLLGTIYDNYGYSFGSLLIGISGVESTFGQHLRCNNVSGIGGVDNYFCFENFESSFEATASLIKKRGTLEVDRISGWYCYSEKTKGECPNWASTVKYFKNELENI